MCLPSRRSSREASVVGVESLGGLGGVRDEIGRGGFRVWGFEVSMQIMWSFSSHGQDFGFHSEKGTTGRAGDVEQSSEMILL